MANEWHYTLNGQQAGAPASPAQLKQLATSGQLQPTDLIWKEGMPNWVPASSIKGLFGSSVSMPPVNAAPAPAGPPEYVPPTDNGDGAPRRSAGGAGIDVILMRSITWNLSAATVTPAEQSQLAAAGVPGETTQRYLAWRRSLLFAIALPTLLAAIFATINLIPLFTVLGGMGVTLVILYLLTLYGLTGAAVGAAFLWTKPKLSRLVLLAAWVAAYVLPLVIVLGPSKWMQPEAPKITSRAEAKNVDFKKMEEDRKKLEEDRKSAVKAMGVFALAMIFPFLAVAPGLTRGGLRIKSLLPGALAPGWVLVTSAGMATLMFFMILGLGDLFRLARLFDNVWLLTIGGLFIMLAPLAFVARAPLFLRPMTRTDEASMKLLQLIVAGILGAGVILIAIFLVTLKPALSPEQEKMLEMAKKAGAKIDTKKEEGPSVILPMLQVYSDYLGRSLFTAVLFADFLLGGIVAGWRNLKRYRSTKDGERYEQGMAELESLATEKKRGRIIEPGDYPPDEG